MDEGQIKYQKLRNLAHDFTHAASVYVAPRAAASSLRLTTGSSIVAKTKQNRYGRIIISERFLPVIEKTIKPTSALGGTAGGLKYVCGGILFKFCVDTPLNDGWMYGGAVASGACACVCACVRAVV